MPLLLVPVVIVAVLLVLVYSALGGSLPGTDPALDDVARPGAITERKAHLIEAGDRRDEVEAELGAPAHVQGSCVFYEVDDAAGAMWRFCFGEDGTLRTKRRAGP